MCEEKMKLKHRFLLATTSHFQSKERFEMFCALAVFFLVCIMSNAIVQKPFFTFAAVTATIIFAIYNLLISLHDSTRFEVILATNDEEAHVRTLLRKL